MKKANYVNFFIIAIIFILYYFVNIYFTQNNVDIMLFHMNYTTNLKYELVIGFYFVFMVISIIYAAKQVFKLFIKHNRNIKLIKSRYVLIFSSLVVGYTYIFFKVDYYYYFGSIILLYMLYFTALFLFDNQYIKSSQKTSVVVNDEVVQQFLKLLGGKDNIINVSYEYSRLKVELKNVKAIQLEDMKALGAKGVFIAGNKLQAVIGNNANALESAIKTYLSQV